jgi:hypothetical protein
MANISSAFGQIIIKAKSTEAIKNLIILQERFERNSHYETELSAFHLNEYELEKDINENAIQTSDGYFIYEDNFTATGRWSFESNVEWFLDSLEFEDNDSEEIRKLKEKCQKEEYAIQFDINDEESGSQFIVSAFATIDYDPKNDIKDYTYDIIANYDYNVENLVKLGFYDEGEILSPSYLINNYDTYFTDEYDKNDAIFMSNKDEIVKLLKSHPYPSSIYYDLDELVIDHTPLEEFLVEKGYD